MSESVDLVELLMCDFCSWEDTAEWIGVSSPKPDALLLYEREGFSLCGFCYRSFSAARWLSYPGDSSLPVATPDFAAEKDLAMFMNIQRAIILGRSVRGPDWSGS